MDSKKTFIAEDEKLARNLGRTYTERFRILIRLIKLTRKMKSATIIQKTAEETAGTDKA